MARALLDLLDKYEAAWPDEAAMVGRVRDLATRHDNCFDRACLPGHITASALVLSPDRRHCLLLHHRKLDRWLQPGGHADGDQDVLRVASREVCEESGLTDVRPLLEAMPLDVDVHRIPARHNAEGAETEPEHEHHDIRFLLIAAGNADLSVSEESHDVRWCTPDQVAALTQEESVLRLVRKASSWMDF